MYQEYSYQNLLKLDHFSTSYDKKNFDVFLCLTVSIGLLTAWCYHQQAYQHHACLSPSPAALHSLHLSADIRPLRSMYTTNDF